MLIGSRSGWPPKLPPLWLIASFAAAACGGGAISDYPDAGDPTVEVDARRPGPGPFAVDDLTGRHGDGCGLPATAALALTPLSAPAAGIQPHAGPIRLPVASRPHPGAAVRPTSSRRGGQSAEPERVVLRLLLLTSTATEPAYTAAKAALDRLGVPHEVVVTTTTELDDDLFRDPDGTCLYQGVILTESSLPIFDENELAWVSTLDDQEWAALAAYEQACAAREVVWYAYPEPGIGMTEASTFTAEDTETAVLTSAGIARFGYLQADAAIPIRDAWGYRGQVIDPGATEVLATAEEGDALAVVHRRPDGTEVLAMTVDSSAYSLHAQLFELGVIRWLTGGRFAGLHRAYLTPQIDDVFLATEMWVPGVGQDPSTVFRMSAADADAHVAWQDELAVRLPAGSRFVSQLAFNGSGTLASEYPNTALVQALHDQQDQFEWINHTWTHTNMDAMARADAEAEMLDNCTLAASWSMPGFSCAEAVTPQISGLDNPDAVAGMIDAGVRLVVSDTSITAALNPENPGTNPSHNVGRRNPSDPRLFQVPRHPTNIFYNCSTPAEEVDLYNTLYGDFFAHELTYEEILEQEAVLGLHYLLAGDADPLMFHQANLRTWSDTEGTHSLYIDWIETVVARFTALVDLPILTLSISDAAALMQARERYDGCGAVALLVRDPAGDRIELSASARCTVPLTGLDAPWAGEVELYGGVPTTYIEVDPCAPVAVPLLEP